MSESMHTSEEPKRVDPPQAEGSSVEPQVAKVDPAFLRLAADYRNLENRSLTARSEGVRLGIEQTCAQFFPVIDQFEMAIRSINAIPEPERKKFDTYISGIRAAMSTLEESMKKIGIEKVQTSGAFHPSVHEAVGETFSDIPAGDVVETTQSGWSLNGTLIRPARVIVSRGSEFAVNIPPPTAHSPQPDL
jgi:molecular chaperone GrpE